VEQVEVAGWAGLVQGVVKYKAVMTVVLLSKIAEQEEAAGFVMLLEDASEAKSAMTAAVLV
jgi:hypothetical protein